MIFTKESYQAMANSASHLAESYDWEAKVNELEGNFDRQKFYLSLASSSRMNAESYQSMADGCDKG